MYKTHNGIKVIMHACLPFMPHACIQSSCATQMLVLLVMFFEAVMILSRNQRHFRVTRALRPLLLLDTHFMAGARRCDTTNNLTLNLYCGIKL